MKNSFIRWIVNFFRPPAKSGLNLGRRQVLSTGIAGLGGGLLFHALPLSASRTFNPELIRPPGSESEDAFLASCVRCGECMKVCPTNVLQPAMLEGGLAGLWSPVLKMRMGFCEYKCNMCGRACPTGAIRPLALEGKQTIRIGLAFIDRNACLPHAYAKRCQVCADHCPLSEKAIWMEEIPVINARGNKVFVKRPYVNADLCIGCGVCANKCPVPGEGAIRIKSVGETRNLKNQLPKRQ